MKKLQLKHLSAYLLYELKGVVKDYNGNNGIEIYKDEVIESICIVEDVLSFKYAPDVYLDTPNEVQFKPILRPLSDLTKEIEVNGVKLIPIEELQKEYDYYYISYNCDGNLLFKRKNEGYTWLHDMRTIDNKLFEWHFDVFGLIEQGLAININTFKKR